MGGIAATACKLPAPDTNFGNHEKTIIIIPELHFPDLGAMLAAADQTL
jgi:hypothetical protein